jgi:AcrR family transcriptional regulator
MKTRPYRMRARADAVARTRRRILQAAFDLANEKASVEIVLSDIAERADTSVQTVLRHFGSRDGLFGALTAFARDEIVEERAAPVGDIVAAIEVIFDHYEMRGDVVLRLLGQEFGDERVRAVTEQGRQTHREWVELVFAPQLGARAEAARDELVDLLVVATDVYTWKLLRRDRRLDRVQAQARVRHLIDAVLAAAREER